MKSNTHCTGKIDYFAVLLLFDDENKVKVPKNYASNN